MAKGLDGKFVHYGIRREDMALIKNLCDESEIDFEWMQDEILKKYHAKKVDTIEISDADTEAIIKSAIQLIK